MLTNVNEVNSEVLFARDPIVTIDSRDVTELERRARANTRKVVRFCAHQDESDVVHEMLIVHSIDAYIRPHRHEDQHAASYHIIKGRLDVIVFDDDGEITHIVEMGDVGSDSKFFWRLSENRYYSMIPRSQQVVFHETLNGPFKPGLSTYPAPWSPADDDPTAVKTYMESLFEKIGRFVEDLK